MRHIKDKANPNIDRVLIYAGDAGHYWRQNGCGYTNSREAGVFTRAEAYALAGHCGPEKLCELHDVPEDHIPTLKQRMEEMSAHVERLEKALDTARVEALWIAQNTAPGGTDSGDLSTNRAARSMVAGIKAALAATPAQSLAAHDAALLREVATQLFDPDGDTEEKEAAERLLAEADRIERDGGKTMWETFSRLQIAAPAGEVRP